MSDLDIQLSEESEQKSSSLYSEDNNFNEDEYEKRMKLISNIQEDKYREGEEEVEIEDDLEEMRQKISRKPRENATKPEKKANTYVAPDLLKTFIMMEICRLHRQATQVDSDRFFAEVLSFFSQESLGMMEQKMKNTSSTEEQLKILLHNFQLYYGLADKEYYILSFAAFCNYHGLTVRLVKAIDLQYFGLESKFQVKIKRHDKQEEECGQPELQMPKQVQESEVLDINLFSYDSKSQVVPTNKYNSDLDKNLSRKAVKSTRSKKFNTDLLTKNANLWMEVFTHNKWVPFDPISDHLLSFDIQLIKDKLHNTSTCFILTTQHIFFRDKDIEQLMNHSRTFKNLYLYDLSWKYCPDIKYLKSRLGIARWFKTFAPEADLFYSSSVDLLDQFCKRFVQADRQEEEELQFKYPPKSLKEVRYSDLFTVKSQIMNYEMIDPQAKSYGEVEKEQLFLKRDVVKLHSKDVWRKYLKIVKEEEIPHPIKEVRGKIQKNSGEATELYSEQQTKDINLSAENGLPSNTYNNFELNYYPPPKGTVIFPKSGFKQPLLKNKIRFLEVTTGFDLKKGKMFASKQGYLIYEEDYEKVQKIYDEHKEYISKRYKEKLQKELLQSWKDIFKQILVQRQIQQQYQQ